MPGRIDQSGNIFIYLNKQEISEFPQKNIEGILIKEPQIKRQGKYNLYSNLNISGIKTNEEFLWIKNDFYLEVLFGRESLNDLKKFGKAYSRISTGGREIFVYEIKSLDNLQKIVLEDINFYIENKDKLSSKFD
jgi:hypothetical protein